MRKLTPNVSSHAPGRAGRAAYAARAKHPWKRTAEADGLAFVRRGQCSPTSARMSISCTSRSPILIFDVCAVFFLALAETPPRRAVEQALSLSIGTLPDGLLRELERFGVGGTVLLDTHQLIIKAGKQELMCELTSRRRELSALQRNTRSRQRARDNGHRGDRAQGEGTCNAGLAWHRVRV